MVKSKPLLSICIPIYNRKDYLERQLMRFSENKELFADQIELLISDNCSEEDLQTCCELYKAGGLNLRYHRNEVNIGPDRNFEWCFKNSTGIYTWLLGSDDIPKSGLLSLIIDSICLKDYGLIHLGKWNTNQIIEFSDNNEMMVAANYWITFMSCNIIRTESVLNLDLSKYRKSNMIQVVAYINACMQSERNLIIKVKELFESNNDNLNNSGYNFFRVFVEHYLNIYKIFIRKGQLSIRAYERIKKIEFIELISIYIAKILIFKTNRNYDSLGAWKIIWEYYGHYAYTYYYISMAVLKLPIKSLLLKMKK